MSGESIEDLKIDFMRLNDKDLSKRFEYKPDEETLKPWLNSSSLKQTINDA